MPTQVQFRRGTTSQNDAFTGAVGELSVDTTLDTIRVHDGSTGGGHRLAKYSDISAGDITAVVAGTGLSGGATSGSATVSLSHLGLESLTDPNDDRIIFWDDSAGASAFLDIGANLAISGTTLAASTQTSLADADADTKIQLEESSDEDTIRFDAAGTEVMKVTSTGLFPSADDTFSLGAANLQWSLSLIHI